MPPLEGNSGWSSRIKLHLFDGNRVSECGHSCARQRVSRDTMRACLQTEMGGRAAAEWPNCRAVGPSRVGPGKRGGAWCKQDTGNEAAVLFCRCTRPLQNNGHNMTFVQHEVTAEHFSTRTFRARLALCWVRGEGQPANSLVFILSLYLHKVMLYFSVTLLDSGKQL